MRGKRSATQSFLKLAGAALVALLVTTVFAQTTATTPERAGGRRFAYETVAIRPTKPGTGGGPIKTTPNGVSGVVGLWYLIQLAYPGNNHIAGLPQWATAAPLYDFEAKMDDDTMAALKQLPAKQQEEQRALMMRAILEDRFQLKVHRENRLEPVYDLVVAKGGPKLTEAKDSAGPPAIGMRSGLIAVRGGSLTNLADVLTHVVERKVVDKTGLAGKYDIQLPYRPDDPNRANPDESAPAIFTALQEELGLKLVPAKEPVDTIVVDHVEQPSEN